jgi:hypothetical protein
MEETKQQGSEASLDNSVQPATSVKQIVMTEQISQILRKLPPKKEDLTFDNVKEALSYRDFTSLLSGLSLKAPRNRTKMDMIVSIVTYIQNIWPELYNVACEYARQNDKPRAEQRQTRVLSRTRSGSTERIQSQESEPSSSQIIETKRLPFDSRLAGNVADMYMSAKSNWEEILMTATPIESDMFCNVFRKIAPEEAPVPPRCSRIDSLMVQYCLGPTKNATQSLNHLQELTNSLNEMIVTCDTPR